MRQGGVGLGLDRLSRYALEVHRLGSVAEHIRRLPFIRLRILSRCGALNSMPKVKSKVAFYAVAKGRSPGIYNTWPEAEAQVKGFVGARHKKFTTIEEARKFVGDNTNIFRGAGQELDLVASKPLRSSVSDPTTQASTSTATSPALVAPVEVSESTSSTKVKRHEPYPSNKHRSDKNSKPKVIKAEWANVQGRYVWCDGSSLGNGKSGSRAGIGLYWSDGVELSERLPGKVQTNNRAELYAVIRVLETDPHPEESLTVLTDSKYTIQCLRDWFPAWSRNDWQTKSGPVNNLDLILYCLLLLRNRKKPPKFVHVPAHTGIEGNERADVLAKGGACKERVHEEVLKAREKTVEVLKQEWEAGINLEIQVR